MRKVLLPLVCAAALPLGGCVAGLGDILGGDPYASSRHDPYAYGRGGPDMEAMAVDACGSQASRYGRASITQVRRVSSSTLRVYGIVDGNYQRRSFACSFREDGRITDFDIN